MKKLDELVIKSTSFIGGVSFVVMVLTIVFNVFARLIFMKSFAWAEEIAYLFLNWAVFMGICILFRHNGLVAIDVLVNALPAGLKRGVTVLIYVMLLLINIGMVVWSFSLGMSTWSGRTTAILKIPFFWYYLAVTIAAVILSGYSIMFLVKLLRGDEIEETALEDRA